MHLVQRGKLLSKIGDELLPLVTQTTSKDTADDLKKVIRLLNEAKKLDKQGLLKDQIKMMKDQMKKI